MKNAKNTPLSIERGKIRTQRANYCQVDMLSAIDKLCYGDADCMTSDEFTAHLRSSTINVIYYCEKIIGYVMYRFAKKDISIIRLCVDKQYDEFNIENELIRSVRHDARGKAITSIVKDDNINFLLMLKALGFKAEQFKHNNKYIFSGYFNDGSDAIKMVDHGSNCC